jgi:hypothetical protein
MTKTPNSLLNDAQYTLIGKIAIASTELELAILGVAKRVSSKALHNDLEVFSIRWRLTKEFETGLDRLAQVQVNPEVYLQRKAHLQRVQEALEKRDAIVHGVVHPGEFNNADFFQVKKQTTSRATLEELENVLDELMRVTADTYALGFTIDKNVEPELLQRLIEGQHTIRYFVCRGFQGNPVLVFRTEWESNALSSEVVWNKKTKRWQPSEDIRKWWLKGETSIDEVTWNEAREQLSLQGHG